ncbi:HalOD1 output domain-containing protein [Haladaptatus halobius]|uniref:HalOD1 output domain-containing protein n=1 Tax=Haladaptatus halobius TaxID=2884875 RepID=UPI001D0B2525
MAPTRTSARSDAEYTYQSSTDETPSEAVVFAVADATECSPLAIDRLNETINVAAMDQLLSTSDGSDPVPTVTFGYYDQQVIVTSDEIHIK